MTTKHAALAAAIAALLAAPAFAQTTDCQISSSNLASDCSSTTTLGAGPAVVTNSSGTTVTSGTGAVVTPGVASTTVTTMPASTVAVTTTKVVPGAVDIPIASTTVMGGPPAGAVVLTPAVPVTAGTQTVVTTYWANVPANAMSRADFRRWEALKP